MFTHKINKNLLEALSNFLECKGILRPKSSRTTALILALGAFSPVHFLPSGARSPIGRHPSKQLFRMLRDECCDWSPQNAREHDKFSPEGGRRDPDHPPPWAEDQEDKQEAPRQTWKMPVGKEHFRQRKGRSKDTKEWHGASQVLRCECTEQRMWERKGETAGRTGRAQGIPDQKS